jgi:hypothetical protein
VLESFDLDWESLHEYLHGLMGTDPLCGAAAASPVPRVFEGRGNGSFA